MKVKDSRPFAERHPKLNLLLGFAMLIGLLVLAIIAVDTAIYYVKRIFSQFVQWIAAVTSGLDAVIIVALITGAVSIVGVVISSVVAKIIDYRKNRQDYLAKKREEPYGEFVEMIYKI